MEPIPENGNLLLFADLRRRPRGDGYRRSGTCGAGDLEYQTRAFFPDKDGNFVLTSGRRVSPVELIHVDARELGEGEPDIAYSILELDARGQVIDDWDAHDLEDARAFLVALAWASVQRLHPTRHDPRMPRMDDGPTDGPPGRELRTAWVELSVEEAYELLESLRYWAEEYEAGDRDPGWHTHVTDAAGRELSVSIKLPGQEGSRAQAETE